MRFTNFIKAVKRAAAPTGDQVFYSCRAMVLKADPVAVQRPVKPLPGTVVYANPGPNRHTRRHPKWSSAGQPYRKNKPLKGRVKDLAPLFP